VRVVAKKKGTPNRNSETVSLPWGAVPHEQFPQERIREQRITEGRTFLSPEVARVEMECTRADNILGINLAAARERAGYTQEQVAEALGKKVLAVKRYESGSTIPDALQLRLLAILYGTSCDVLLGLCYGGEAEIAELYSFSTPRQRDAMLRAARLIQSGAGESNIYAEKDAKGWKFELSKRLRRLFQNTKS
jgi:transcriptional regulator with XRE-family HTH domain